jgi:hypothetical protein
MKHIKFLKKCQNHRTLLQGYPAQGLGRHLSPPSLAFFASYSIINWLLDGFIEANCSSWPILAISYYSAFLGWLIIGAAQWKISIRGTHRKQLKYGEKVAVCILPSRTYCEWIWAHFKYFARGRFYQKTLEDSSPPAVNTALSTPLSYLIKSLLFAG